MTHLRGASLMALACLILPVVDGAAKQLTTQHSVWMIGWARYAVATAILLPWLLRQRPLRRRRQLTGDLVRTALLVGAMTSYFAAIREVPLVAAATAYFVGPVIAMVLGVLALGEELTRLKVVSAAGAVGGSCLVIGPDVDSNGGVLLALLAGALYACYLVCTRAATSRGGGGERGTVASLGVQSAAAALMLSPTAAATWSAPSLDEWWLFLALGSVSVMCQGMVIAALTQAETSTLAPLVYLELVGAAIVGMAMFGEAPELRVILGAIVIVLSGLASRRSAARARRPGRPAAFAGANAQPVRVLGD